MKWRVLTSGYTYPTINNGVYRCGFAKSQEAYDEAIEELTESFDKLESLLGKRRYLCGDQFTLSDVRLFVTLLRFDPVYFVYFKTDTRSVAHSPNILNYCREVYNAGRQADGRHGANQEPLLHLPSRLEQV